MPLKNETSLMVGLATAAGVWGIHQNMLPSIADIRLGPVGDLDIDDSERAATITAMALVGGISLMAKDWTVLIIGGSAAIAMAWLTRHANTVDPRTGSATTPATEAGMPDGSLDVVEDEGVVAYEG